MDHSCFRK